MTTIQCQCAIKRHCWSTYRTLVFDNLFFRRNQITNVRQIGTHTDSLAGNERKNYVWKAKRLWVFFMACLHCEVSHQSPRLWHSKLIEAVDIRTWRIIACYIFAGMRLSRKMFYQTSRLVKSSHFWPLTHLFLIKVLKKMTFILFWSGDVSNDGINTKWENIL